MESSSKSGVPFGGSRLGVLGGGTTRGNTWGEDNQEVFLRGGTRR